MAVPEPGVWGIDVGQCALKALRLQMVEGQVTATAFDYIEHPKILSQPDADPDQLTREALEQFLSRNQLKGDLVVIGVPGQSGLARFVKLPPVEEKKIADIVKFEAKQQIPFPLEEVVWDFQKIGSGEVTDGFALETEIGLFAMKRDMVNRSLQQFRDVGVECHVVQMSPLALCNFVAYELLGKGAEAAGEDDKQCIVALDLGTDNSNLIITDGGSIIWQRPIPLGGNHFTRALTKDLKLTFAKAEHLKRNAVKSPDLKKILASLKTVLNEFVGEVQRSLGYFTNTHRDAQIQYMIGLGNAFRLPGLQKYLQEKLQLEVRKLSELDKVVGEEVTGAPTFTENILSFGVATGLALQGLKLTRLQTNLLPQEIRTERLIRAKKPWAVAAAAALLLAVVGLSFGQSKEKAEVTGNDIKTLLDGAKSTIDKANELKVAYDGQIERAKKARESIRRIGAGVEERFNWQLLYQFVNMALPKANGEGLVERARNNLRVKQKYNTPEARKAFDLLEKRRFARKDDVAKIDLRKLAEEEEYIKKHLIQINVEGVTPLYTEDLPTFFKALHAEKILFRGMTAQERDVINTVAKGEKADDEEFKKKIPPKGWLVEVRGYTYNEGAEEFVESTILENLGNPLGVYPNLAKERPDLYDVACKNISFLLLYRIEKDKNPQIGIFKHIGASSLRPLLGGGNALGGIKGGPAGPVGSDPMAPGIDPAGDPTAKAKADRTAWQPIGEVASRTVQSGGGAGGPGGQILPGGVPPATPMGPTGPLGPGGVPVRLEGMPPKQPRTEFVIFFLWREPLPEPMTTEDVPIVE